MSNVTAIAPVHISVGDMEHTLKTDKGDVHLSIDFSSGDSWFVSFQGAIRSRQMRNYDEHYDCIFFYGGDDIHDVVRGAAKLLTENYGFVIDPSTIP